VGHAGGLLGGQEVGRRGLEERDRRATGEGERVVTLVTSTTASIPASADARPAPVVTSTPSDRASTTGSWPSSRQRSTT
jgi:hypothetical protein